MGKFIDEILQLVHLLDDSRVHLSKIAPLPLEQFGIPLSQPLGGQLDGRKRIFDLVSDTPRDLTPCLHSLHFLNLGDILEKDHDAHGVSSSSRRLQP
jgi:hypothetical protein